MPELLVSVRSVVEATAAVQGGCDIVDIKEPANGPLGMADVDVIDSIVSKCRQLSSQPVSVALGDVDEWPAARILPVRLNDCDYLKIGPGTLEQPNEWLQRLTDIQERFAASRITHPCWIAALYADRPLLSSITPSYLKSLRDAGFVGLMIDTAGKTGQSLLDAVSQEELRIFLQRCREAGLRIGLAGSLTLASIELLLSEGIRPDLFGVRSAACADHDRSGSVQEALVEQLRVALVAHA